MAHVNFSLEGRLARVHLNRPEALNAITPEMDDVLAAAWRRINDDPDIWVAMLSSEGNQAFCAGADLQSGIGGERGHAFGGGLTGIGGPLVELRKPLVAAIQGHAVGGGCELALCADLIVASDTAQFALPEVKSGLIDHSGVLHRAFRKLPYNIAMEMVMTGRRLGAEEAYRLGLANRVVPASDLQNAALTLCDQLLSAPPLATQAAKEAANEGLKVSLEEALARTYPTIARYRGSRDAAEATAGLLERRAPQWSGN